MRWPEREHVLRQVQAWAKEQVCRVASLERVAVFGSYGWGTAGVGSDLDLLLIDAAASGPQHERLRSCSRPNRAFPASSSGMPCGCGLGG
jgi:predicted nucleotidyltransferase